MSCHFFVRSISFAVILVSKSALGGSIRISSFFLLSSLPRFDRSLKDFFFLTGVVLPLVDSTAARFLASGGSQFELWIFRKPYLKKSTFHSQQTRTDRYSEQLLFPGPAGCVSRKRCRRQGHSFWRSEDDYMPCVCEGTQTGPVSRKGHRTWQNCSFAWTEWICLRGTRRDWEAAG